MANNIKTVVNSVQGSKIPSSIPVNKGKCTVINFVTNNEKQKKRHKK